MDAQAMAADLETRAKAAGLNITKVCEQANVARSTFTRWKRGDTAPNLATYNKLVEIIDATRRAA